MTKRNQRTTGEMISTIVFAGGGLVLLGGALDPVGSSLEFGPDAYDDLMHAIADTLLSCLKP